MKITTLWPGKAAGAAALIALVAAGAGTAWWWQHRDSATPPAAASPAAVAAPGAGTPADARLIQGSDPNTPFVISQCVARLSDDSPSLVLMFSQPLDRKQNLDTAIKVLDFGVVAAEGDKAVAKAPDAKPNQGRLLKAHWIVGDNPRVAYAPFVPPQHRFTVEVQATVLAGDGRKLAEAKSCELRSDTMAPSYYFASKGVVLPAKQNGGLPIITVNVPEVDVQFLRVNAADLPRFFQKVAGAKRSATATADEIESDRYASEGYDYNPNPSLKGRVNNWELDQINGSIRSVYTARFTAEAKPDLRRVTFLPIEDIKELQDPGVYIAVMSQPGRFAQDFQVTYFYVSDIGLHAQRHANSLDAFATSLKTAQALSGVNFELLDENGRSLAKAQGDGDGHALLASVPDSATLLVARRDKEMSVIALREPGLDLSEFDIGGHPSRNTKLFAYAGRDLYRPGETFQISVLARGADGQAIAPAPITATLKRPDGRAVNTASWAPDPKQPGYFQHAVALPADAPTGAWLLELRADPGAKQPDAVRKIQVEEFLPERMKLDLSGPAPILQRGQDFDVEVKGTYLFGAPAAGNRLLINATTERQRQALPQSWPGFVFGDFADDAERKRGDLPEQSLDDAGNASVTLPMAATGARSPMLVRGSFSLLESGGRPVVRSIERAVWPAAELLALRPLFDGDVAKEGTLAEFELTRVDSAGRYAPLPAPSQVAVRLLREDRSYYWRYEDQRGWTSGYTESDEPLESSSVALSGQRTRLRLPVGYGRYRLEVDDPKTGLKLRYRFYAGWGAQDAELLGARPDRVQLQLANLPLEPTQGRAEVDSPPRGAGDIPRRPGGTLKPGQPALLRIKPPHDGQALITVQGDKLLWSKRISVSAAGTELSLPMDPAWSRHDLYVTATVFRPGNAGDKVTPARALGLLHLPLARDERKLKLTIKVADKIRPETKLPVTLKVEGLAGMAASTALVTVSAVDVGILNITHYKSPDPVDFFFGKHRLEVDLADMYGKLIEKMDGQRGKLAFGGDSRMRDSKSLPKKVKLVDLFSGPVKLDAKGEAVVVLDIPDFNGTLRLMAVAATADKFGQAEAQTVSAAPLVAELSTPRFISPGDAATLALDVTNLTEQTQSIQVKLDAAEPVRISSGAEQSLVLKPKQRSTLRFAAEATDAYGLGRLRLSVSSASGIKIVRESVLQVQPPAPLEREVRRVKLEAGATLKLDQLMLAPYYKGSSTLNLSLSNKPPLNVKALVAGLLDYSYGCLEQTTSAAYPHLYIDDVGATALGLTPRSREQRAAFVEGAIARLAGMQKSNGGYTLWGDGPYESWLSAYVTGFLMDARQQGFNVPEALVKKSHDWLLQELQQTAHRIPALPASATQAGTEQFKNWQDYERIREGHSQFAALAHAGYMLAREQKAPLAQLRLLHDSYRDRARSPLPLVHLSLALQLMGDAARAKVALEEAMTRPYGIGNRSGYGNYEWLYDYGSGPRDLAMAYALLVRHEVQHPRRENLLFDLAARLGPRNYYSTQERLALFLAARAAGADASDQEWTVLLKTAADKPEAISSKTTASRGLGGASLARGVTLTSQSGSALFVELDAAGYPTKPPAQRSDVMEVQRDWFDSDGKPLTGRSHSVGDIVIVQVKVRAKYAVHDALLVERVPAGFEVENLNLSQGPRAQELMVDKVNVGQAMGSARIKHREYRDDRFAAALDLDGNWLNLFYLLRAVTPGRYVVPPSFVEDMYRPELRGSGPAEAARTVVDPRRTGPAAAVAEGASAPR